MKRLTAHYETLLTAAARDPEQDITRAPVPDGRRDPLARIAGRQTGGSRGSLRSRGHRRPCPRHAYCHGRDGAGPERHLRGSRGGRQPRSRDVSPAIDPPWASWSSRGPIKPSPSSALLPAPAAPWCCSIRASAERLAAITAQAGIARVTPRSLACRFPDLTGAPYLDEPSPDLHRRRPHR